MAEPTPPVECHVSSGTARLWACASGAGTPLLMFNGGPGCNDYLGPVAAMIDDLCRVIRFEPRGCGRSAWDGNYDLDTLLRDADAVRAAHAAERCIVAGHSFGPNAALAYALRHPSRVLKRPSLFREIANLQIPATFIYGGEDIRPNWPTRQLAALLPRGEYVEIAGAAHTIWLRHAAELRTELRRAVRRLVPACAEA